MDIIPVRTSVKEYPVIVGKDVLVNLLHFLEENVTDITKIMIITDETVATLYLQKVKQLLKNYDVIDYIVPKGEKAKTFDVYQQTITFALKNKLDRKSLMIALGGGAVGDLTGFVAATYMRGIPFIQVPTTILAHDSAVGGKTAINHEFGKNMVGAFYQPIAVFYDVQFFETLPINELRSGFAELIKHALIADRHFYKHLMNNIHDLSFIQEQLLIEALVKGISIKAQIVSQDEKELGIRAFLNFGHTLGHAIEAELGFGKITHGEAVMIGMIYALSISINLNSLSFDLAEFKAWVKKLGYETFIPHCIQQEKLLERMKQDKKSKNQQIRLVLLNEIGEPVIKNISEAQLKEAMKIMMEGESND